MEGLNVYKKRFTFLLLFFLVMSSVIFVETPIYALENKINNQDATIVESMILQIATDEGKDLEKLVFTVKNIYFSNEEWAGYVIDFNSNQEIGYAIVFKIEGKLKLIELFFGRKSPYYKQGGMPIYFSLGYYYVKRDDKLIEVSTNKASEKFISNFDLEQDSIFFGSNKKDKDGVDETINILYKRGYKYSYEIPNFFYNYGTWLTDHSNNCANAAGLILLNHWNKKYNNDLLMLDSSLLNNSNIWYNNTKDARKEYMGIFYDYMNTNWLFGIGGTLPLDGYKGFERLIKEKGYQVQRDRNISYAQMRSKISSGIPIMITSIDYYYSNRSNETNLPSVNSTNGTHNLSIDYEHTWGIANAHTFIGYGYTYYSLYHDVEKKVWSPVWYNPFRYITIIETEHFYEELIKIANGWGTTCYFNYSRSNVFDNAAINVFN